MSENPERQDRPAVPADGAPKQALSGGGSEIRAGSAQGGSASGAEPEAPEGGFKPSPEEADPQAAPEPASFASPEGEGATESQAAVNNTGEPDAAARKEGVEGRPDDDVDAATG